MNLYNKNIHVYYMPKYFNIFLIFIVILIVGIVLSYYYKRKDNNQVKEKKPELSNQFYWGKNEKYRK